MRRLLLVLFVVACGKSGSSSQSSASKEAAPPIVISPVGGCPANGQWAACSVIYRLERSGLAPHVDSTAEPNEKSLGGSPLILKIGVSAVLELHFYADSTARAAAASALDRTQFVSGTAPQTIKRERTLIESMNLIGLLTSINGHQRERVSDALLAGPPQPPTAQPIRAP